MGDCGGLLPFSARDGLNGYDYDDDDEGARGDGRSYDAGSYEGSYDAAEELTSGDAPSGGVGNAATPLPAFCDGPLAAWAGEWAHEAGGDRSHIELRATDSRTHEQAHATPSTGDTTIVLRNLERSWSPARGTVRGTTSVEVVFNGVRVGGNLVRSPQKSREGWSIEWANGYTWSRVSPSPLCSRAPAALHDLGHHALSDDRRRMRIRMRPRRRTSGCDDGRPTYAPEATHRLSDADTTLPPCAPAPPPFDLTAPLRPPTLPPSPAPIAAADPAKGPNPIPTSSPSPLPLSPLALLVAPPPSPCPHHPPQERHAPEDHVLGDGEALVDAVIVSALTATLTAAATLFLWLTARRFRSWRRGRRPGHKRLAGDAIELHEDGAVEGDGAGPGGSDATCSSLSQF